MIGRERFGNKLPKKPEQTTVPAAPNVTVPAKQPPKLIVKPSGKKPTPTIVHTEKVTCLCGHEIDFPHFADKQDKFRDQRRQNVMGQNCPACRKKKHEELIAKQKSEAAERRKNKIDKGRMVPRLPSGSQFTCQYYEQPKPHWKGELRIPDVGGTLVEKRFTGEASGLFTLEVNLDKQYRQWLKEQKGEVPAG